MNILFAIYGDLTCNSASHVDGVARALAARGVNCIVSMPEPVKGEERFPNAPYQAAGFEEILEKGVLFSDGRGPDVVHFWNPREVNRRFHERLSRGRKYKMVIHLEDNEEHIARCILGQHAYDLALRNAYPGEFPLGFSHPVHSKRFMEQAAGFSLLIDALVEKIPQGAPSTVFWPATDPAIFYPRARNNALRQELGISPDTCVLTYHGNVHTANHREVRSLYLATALLNRRGIPTKLIRLGDDYVPRTHDEQDWADEFTISMGFIIDRKVIANTLAAADVFVQPGTSDAFNDYRFPSKVPEFFALGRPVVLPKSNIGLVARHMTDAYVLEEANGIAICEAVGHIWSDQNLRAQLERGAREFAARFSWDRSAESLLELYDRLGASRLRYTSAAA